MELFDCNPQHIQYRAMNTHMDKVVEALFLSLDKSDRVAILGRFNALLDAPMKPVMDITKLVPPGGTNDANWSDWINGVMATFMAGLDNPKNTMMNLANSYIAQKYPKIREILGYTGQTATQLAAPISPGLPATNDINYNWGHEMEVNDDDGNPLFYGDNEWNQDDAEYADFNSLLTGRMVNDDSFDPAYGFGVGDVPLNIAFNPELAGDQALIDLIGRMAKEGLSASPASSLYAAKNLAKGRTVDAGYDVPADARKGRERRYPFVFRRTKAERKQDRLEKRQDRLEDKKQRKAGRIARKISVIRIKKSGNPTIDAITSQFANKLAGTKKGDIIPDIVQGSQRFLRGEIADKDYQILIGEGSIPVAVPVTNTAMIDRLLDADYDLADKVSAGDLSEIQRAIVHDYEQKLDTMGTGDIEFSNIPTDINIVLEGIGEMLRTANRQARLSWGSGDVGWVHTNDPFINKDILGEKTVEATMGKGFLGAALSGLGLAAKVGKKVLPKAAKLFKRARGIRKAKKAAAIAKAAPTSLKGKLVAGAKDFATTAALGAGATHLVNRLQNKPAADFGGGLPAEYQGISPDQALGIPGQSLPQMDELGTPLGMPGALGSQTTGLNPSTANRVVIRIPLGDISPSMADMDLDVSVGGDVRLVSSNYLTGDIDEDHVSPIISVLD